MTFKKTFCSSPWIHMRINNSGAYEYCRWNKFAGSRVDFENNIQQHSPNVFFQKNLASLRQKFLDGHAPTDCSACYEMEQHGKTSGRLRQLLKVGVLSDHFEPSLASSPLRADFDYSAEHQGHTLRQVSDWQIDLGNYCNSACIFCSPEASSRLAAEHYRLQLIDQLPPKSWCDDPVLLQRFIDDLLANENIKYLHFIGGETLITPGFRAILQPMVDAGKSKTITVGFTTNLTVWDQDIADLLGNFEQVNLGLSIEALTPINDYVRWPGQLNRTRELLDQWVNLSKQQGWLTQLRMTPTCLTIHDLTTIFDYAWEHELSVESCNFIQNPAFMRLSVLPPTLRTLIAEKIADWIKQHPADHSKKILNTRNPALSHSQIVQDAQSYVDYLRHAPDESYRLPDLARYLKQLESGRGNSILDYLPEYEDLLRSAGY